MLATIYNDEDLLQPTMSKITEVKKLQNIKETKTIFMFSLN